MPERDLRSNLEMQLALNGLIATNTTTDGFIIDTAHYDSGVMFGFAVTSYVDGTYAVNLQDGDESDLSDAATIADAKIIGDKSTIILTAGTAEGALLSTLGITDTKRYVRVQIISTLTSDGAIISVVAVKKAELLPVIDPDV